MTPPEPEDGHVGDELPLLLGGELGRERWRQVVGHLRDCSRCQGELVDATSAHAALTAARRVLDPPMTRASSPEAPDEPPALPPLRVRRSHRRDLLVGLTAAVVAAAVVLGGVALTGGRLGRAPAVPAAAAQHARLVPVVAASGSAPAPSAAGVVSMSGSGRSS